MMMNPSTDDYQFVAKLGNLKTVVQLLRSINHRENATFYCTEKGLKITVEDSKCIQATAYIPIQVFQEFNLKENVEFKISLTVLVECLGMFWSSMSSASASVGLQLFYEGQGHPVTVLIEEDGIITDCSLKTQDPDGLLDFYMDSDLLLSRVVLKTSLFKDIWTDLDPSSEYLEVLLSPEAPYFRITSNGLAGECRIEFPHDSDLITTFECKKEASFSYRFAHMKPAMKALGCSDTISLRTDENGLLCFQFMVKTDDNHICYVEYYLSPSIINEDF